MIQILGALIAISARLFRSRRDLLLENLALRQQLRVLVRKPPRRRLSLSGKLFWVALSRFWSEWKRALLIVQPETVVRWHRAGFKLYWKWISRKHGKVGRQPTSKELRDLIFRMVAENGTWGAPRIHRELKLLGFAAMDFFTVPTMTFGVLYCFFVIVHGRRQVLHCKVTRHPTSAWVIQQLREAFPYECRSRYLIFDRGGSFNEEVAETIKSFGMEPKRTSFQSPWQNGIAERFVGSCRRDLLDHVIVLDERHLKRLMTEYVRYYHDDRTHLGLGKQTPTGRNAATNVAMSMTITSLPRLGGLHHRYDLAA
jgi:putative transposase